MVALLCTCRYMVLVAARRSRATLGVRAATAHEHLLTASSPSSLLLVHIYAHRISFHLLRFLRQDGAEPGRAEPVHLRQLRHTSFHLSRRCQGHRQQTVHLWRPERITLSAAACGFFRSRRVKVFVNTAAHEEITLHQLLIPLLLLAEHLCQSVSRTEHRARVSLELAAPSAVSASRPSEGRF